MVGRIAALSLLLCLAACAGNPAALGITGPGAAPPAAQTETPMPGVDALAPGVSSNRYAPTLAPTTNGGRYWGYN